MILYVVYKLHNKASEYSDLWYNIKDFGVYKVAGVRGGSTLDLGNIFGEKSMLSGIEVNVLALIICGGIYLRIKKYKLEVIGTKRFLEMFFLMVIVLGSEMVSVTLESGIIRYHFYWCHMFVVAFYFLGQVILTYILLLFNLELQGKWLGKKLQLVLGIPIYFTAVILAINLFNPFVYGVGDGSEYVRLQSYPLVVCAAFLYVFIDVIVAAIGYISDKSSKVKKYCFIFNVSMVVEGIVSFIVFGLELFPMVATSLLFLFLSISDKRSTEIDEEASTDSLTGLGNAKAYQKKITELEEYENYKKVGNYAVVVMDINNLKITNDQFGHEVGNELIIATAECIAECFEDCSAFRMGGDEFVAIIEGTLFDDRDKIFNCFIDKSNSRFILVSSGKIKLQVAVGMSEFVYGKNNSYIETFRLADKAMYENKYKSKNM